MSKRLAVIDIDGVIADERHRVKHALDRDWSTYFGLMDGDSVWPQGRELYEACAMLGFERAYLTGRREDTRKVTTAWLKRNGFNHKLPLMMRKVEDRTPLADLKAVVTTSLTRLRIYKGIWVYDDDPHVIEKVAKVEGVHARHCTWYTKPERLVRKAEF